MPNLKEVLTDSNSMGERNDCAVIATANVLDIPYREAHALLAKHGRRRRCGTKLRITVAVLKERAVTYKENEGLYAMSNTYLPGTFVINHRAPQPTVAQFLRRLPKTGRFFLTCTTHAFAYVNGQLLDNIYGSKMRARMRYCAEIGLNQPVQHVEVAPAVPVQAPKPQPATLEARPKFNPIKAELAQLTAELGQPGANLSAIFERIKILQAKL